MPQFLRRMRGAPAALRRAVERHARTTARELQAEVRRQAPKRTGRLRRSLQVDGKAKGPDSAIRIRSDHPAARELEQGGLKSGDPWLAVPVRDEVRHLESPRRDGRLISIQGRDGRIFLMDAARGQIRWRLLRRVRVVKDPFVSRAVDKLERRIQRSLLDHLDREVRR